MENEILADIPNEGEAFSFGEEEKETLSESPTEEKPVVDEPAEEGGNTPTEEEPDYKPRTDKRIQQLLKERAEERERREALEERLAALEQRNTPQDEEIPEEFVDLFGDDPEAWKKFDALTQRQKAAWKQEMAAELQAQEEQETNEHEQYAQTYETLMDELEDDGKVFDRNALMKFMNEVPNGLWTTDGQPNFALGLELMEARKPKANVQARKHIAAIDPKGSTVGSKGYKTPDDLKGGWSSI